MYINNYLVVPGPSPEPNGRSCLDTVQIYYLQFLSCTLNKETTTSMVSVQGWEEPAASHRLYSAPCL